MERFWKKVQIGSDDECWPWSAGVSRYGYGRFGFRKANWQAHRVAYTLTKGEVSPGMVIMHSCNNRLCCNPSHLAEGTQGENCVYTAQCGRSGRSQLRRQLSDTELQIALSARSYRQAAAELRVGHHTVRNIRKSFKTGGTQN